MVLFFFCLFFCFSYKKERTCNFSRCARVCAWNMRDTHSQVYGVLPFFFSDSSTQARTHARAYAHTHIYRNLRFTTFLRRARLRVRRHARNTRQVLMHRSSYSHARILSNVSALIRHAALRVSFPVPHIFTSFLFPYTQQINALLNNPECKWKTQVKLKIFNTIFVILECSFNMFSRTYTRERELVQVGKRAFRSDHARSRKLSLSSDKRGRAPKNFASFGKMSENHFFVT